MSSKRTASGFVEALLPPPNSDADLFCLLKHYRGSGGLLLLRILPRRVFLYGKSHPETY